MRFGPVENMEGPRLHAAQRRKMGRGLIFCLPDRRRFVCASKKGRGRGHKKLLQGDGTFGLEHPEPLTGCAIARHPLPTKVIDEGSEFWLV